MLVPCRAWRRKPSSQTAEDEDAAARLWSLGEELLGINWTIG